MLKMAKNFFEIHPYISVFITALFLVLSVSIMNFRSYGIDYLNSETTLHVLLTMHCYDDIPFSIHKFLPIVTVDGTKFVPWGATISDHYGNFYHTSFSSAGHFIPYIFIKLIHLFINTDSSFLLYIFNTILFVLSAYLWGIIIYLCFMRNKLFLALLGVMLYVFSPENIHSMGYVYWHQSIFQVTFLLQLLGYITNRAWLFGLMTFINPYIEWTGYIANVGFAMAEFIKYKKNLKQAFMKSLYIGMLTLYSLIFLCCHWLMVVDAKDFFGTSLSRLYARGVTQNSYMELLVGYIDSFRYLWLLLGILIIFNIRDKVFRKKEYWLVLFLIFFPCLENCIVLRHAILYPYDRMKIVFPLSFMICTLVSNLIYKFHEVKKYIFVFSLAICLTNFISYRYDISRIWKFNYIQTNQYMADSVKSYKGKALFIGYGLVRGYMSLLFDENMYENWNFNEVKEIAIRQNIPYIVEVLPTYISPEKLPIITDITITNLQTNDEEVLSSIIN